MNTVKTLTRIENEQESTAKHKPESVEIIEGVGLYKDYQDYGVLEIHEIPDWVRYQFAEDERNGVEESKHYKLFEKYGSDAIPDFPVPIHIHVRPCELWMIGQTLVAEGKIHQRVGEYFKAESFCDEQ